MLRSLLHVFAHALALASGVVCLYTSLFLYEDEKGRIQSKLEEWWARLDDARNHAVSRNTALLGFVARLELRILNRIFGETLFSFRAVGVSVCLSLASMGFATLLSCTLIEVRGGTPPLSIFGMSIILAATMAFLLFATLPSVAQRWLLVLWYVLITLILLIVIGMFFTATTARRAALLCVALVVSFGCDVAFVFLTRQAMRRVSSMDTLWRIIMVVVTNSLLGILLFVVPAVSVVERIGRYSSALEHAPFLYVALGLIAALNEVTVIVGLVFAILASVMLLHRIFWPIIQRPLYAVQAIGIARRHKLLFIIGAVLLGAVGITLPSTLREVLSNLP